VEITPMTGYLNSARSVNVRSFSSASGCAEGGDDTGGAEEHRPPPLLHEL